MTKRDFSISFTVESDESTMEQIAARLNRQLVGQIKDMVAQSLDGLDFDLKDRYWLLSPADDEEAAAARGDAESIPVWSAATGQVVRIRVGSGDWFKLVESRKFQYQYKNIRFTVRLETRKSKGKDYTYWRAYATIGGKLRAKQIGKTDQLRRAALDEVGQYFWNLRQVSNRPRLRLPG